MPDRPAGSSTAAGSSKTLDKALTLLRFVVMRGEALALADVARETGLPKPTLHRLLGVLAAHGLVRLDRDGRYHPGPVLLVYGTAYLGSTDLRRESLDLLAELMSATGETAHLGVLQPPNVVYVEKVESPQAVRMHSTIGGLSPIHSTGLGKAMLAHSNPGVIDVELRRPLERRTDKTITDAALLREELEVIRSRGYAIDDIENEEGIRCVGAPVFDHQGEMIGGVSVAGPDTRVTPAAADEIAPIVVDVAVRLSRRLGYAGTLPATSPRR
ncbi:MAG: IclR family transcriptional regulator [Ilumatobacter sp.]